MYHISERKIASLAREEQEDEGGSLIVRDCHFIFFTPRTVPY